MTCVYREKKHPDNRIVFQCRNDRHEQLIALRRRAEKLGLTPSDFEEVRPSSKAGNRRGT